MNSFRIFSVYSVSQLSKRAWLLLFDSGMYLNPGQEANMLAMELRSHLMSLQRNAAVQHFGFLTCAKTTACRGLHVPQFSLITSMPVNFGTARLRINFGRHLRSLCLKPQSWPSSCPLLTGPN